MSLLVASEAAHCRPLSQPAGDLRTAERYALLFLGSSPIRSITGRCRPVNRRCYSRQADHWQDGSFATYPPKNP